MITSFKHLYISAALAATCFCASCSSDPKPTPGTPPADTSRVDTTTRKTPPPDTAGLPPFDGERAFKEVERQVGFGPRNPNSPGAKKALGYMIAELSKHADAVTPQSFTHQGYGETLRLTNVIAAFNAKATNRILLLAHWDSRPRADQDPNPAVHDKPILAANDAGSGVGVLLELARVMKEHPLPPNVGIDLLLVDGEDYGKEDDLENYFLGARYFAKNLPPGYRPSFAVLIDMVGDKEARFQKDPLSLEKAPSVVNVLWDAARVLGLKQFVQTQGPPVSDDHVPMNDAGIPTIDIIDGELVGGRASDPRRKYWHTHNDTMENISSETLGSVGNLLVYMIYRLAPKAGSAA